MKCLLAAALPMLVGATFPQPPLMGWPFLKENPVSPPEAVNVQTIQSLCDPAIEVDGVFGPKTTECVKKLQTSAGVTSDGEVSNNTWIALFDKRLPLSPDSSAADLNAVIRQFNGYYGANLTLGTWSSDLEDHVKSWQKAQGLRTPDGRLQLDEFQRLVGGVVPNLGVYGFDIGWPEGSASQSSLSCLADAGFSYAIMECWTEQPHSAGHVQGPGGGYFFEPCVDNIAKAWEAGFDSVSAYFFPQRNGDPTLQAQGMLDALEKAGTKYDKVMIDVERGWDGLPIEDNVKFLSDVVSVFNATAHPVVMYVGREWPKWFGNWTGLSSLELVYAHYDQIPSYRDWWGQPYGGWKRPAAKQLWDHSDGPTSSCGLEIDWEWSDVKWP